MSSILVLSSFFVSCLWILHWCWKKDESVSRSVEFDSLWPHGLYTRLLCPWNSPGKNTEVGCCFLLQGISATQGSNQGPPTLQANSLPYEPPGKPKGRVGPPQLQMEGAWDPWVDCVEQSPDHWSTPDCDVRGGSTFRILSHWDSGVVRYSS